MAMTRRGAMELNNGQLECSVNTHFRRNEGFQGETSNSSATIVNRLCFSKIKTTQVVLLCFIPKVLKRKSSQKRVLKKVLVTEKTTQVKVFRYFTPLRNSMDSSRPLSLQAKCSQFWSILLYLFHGH